MSGSFHLPTAIVVAGAMVLLYALVRLVRHGRNGSRGFVSDVDHATHATLHTASLAARHLQDGLTAEGVGRAARHLRQLLGSPAIAVTDATSLLAWDGAADHHAARALEDAEEVLRTGHTIVLGAGQVSCSDPDCPVRAAVIAPVVTGIVCGVLWMVDYLHLSLFQLNALAMLTVTGVVEFVSTLWVRNVVVPRLLWS